MNLKLFLNKNFGRHEPFTIDQFLADANDNVDHLSPGLSRTWGFEFRSMVVDGSSTRTSSMMTTEDQALILINKQILRDCYTFLNKPIRSFYGRNSARFGIGEDLFTRLAMGSSMLMAFWHEVAHIVRGHYSYNKKLESDAANGRASVADRIPLRVAEIDADIYGGQFLLTQLAVISRSLPEISIATFAQSYAIGVRGLFESLEGPNSRHDDAPGSVHPSPINRAYTAYTHALARASDMGFTDAECATLLVAGQQALLQFEVLDLGFRVDPDALRKFSETELPLWRAREGEFFPYQPKSAVRK